MSANTKIEWADHTFNPWEGCQKVGPGCDHCYAEARNARFGGGQAVNWGPGAPRRRTSAKNWQLPIKWNVEAAAKGIRYRVFCASLADVFDNAVDPAWRVDLFDLIEATPNLDWLLLTKRIGNVQPMMCDVGHSRVWLDRQIAAGQLPRNVWLGVTVVNQDEYDRDAQKLLRVPASKRFLSIEPLLGPIHGAPSIGAFDWVIVGGESGHGARPMHPDWARSLHDQCDWYSVPFFFKQWGEWLPAMQHGAREGAFIEINASDAPVRVGKKAAGRHLDGRTWDEVPS